MKIFKSLFIGMFLIIGSLLIFSSEDVDARDDANCVYDPIEFDCYDTSQFNCTCIVVSPDPGEGG